MDIRATMSAAILGAGMALASPAIDMAIAHADVDSFLTDMEAAGFSNDNGNDAEIAIGQNICAEVAGGMSPSQVARDLWHHSQMNQDDSTRFVAIAISDLCPESAS
ncbi:hypothetical protein A5676_13025 [Mycobacterium malmoense]|uniref:DUF732 domain-containing protein n=1 Tax=Mycobacterium malmoense TaxID=1780 RepID=UPI00080B9AC0|nr:DUF732 domain-containing protein [Mycobacterium malmoense]OCB39601.1 hypothetical protein A5676_13025 [Mycobacterium malmoense]